MVWLFWLGLSGWVCLVGVGECICRPVQYEILGCVKGSQNIVGASACKIQIYYMFYMFSAPLNLTRDNFPLVHLTRFFPYLNCN